MFSASINLEGLQALTKAKDPVCAKELEASTAAASIIHEGKTFYFCSQDCKKEFEKDKAKYAVNA
jgi:Cu+-exporting ATPase